MEIKNPNLGEGGRQHVLFTRALEPCNCPQKSEWTNLDTRLQDGAGVLAFALFMSLGLGWASRALSGIGQRR